MYNVLGGNGLSLTENDAAGINFRLMHTMQILYKLLLKIFEKIFFFLFQLKNMK